MNTDPSSTSITRRHFVSATAATITGATLLRPGLVGAAEANSKIDVGLIGCGGRGKWIADLFAKNGSYNLVAVADYFQDRVDDTGSKFGVPAERRFAGLNGYRKLLEQKLDAVIIKTPPYFHPEQAAAAVAAGKHVYLAKPIAVDVPGCVSIEESGRKASEKKLSFLVDFQTRASAEFQQAVRHVKEGMIGKLVSGEATYFCGPTFTGPSGALKKNPNDPETQLRNWGLNRVLSGDVITEQNIHALDVACWILGSDPIKAVGAGGEARGLGGTCWDHYSVTYWFPNEILLSFSSKQYGHAWDDICCRIYGLEGTIDTHYFESVSVKGQGDGYSAKVKNLYAEGAINNIAAFANAIQKGDYSNPTVSESVRSNLTTILGRTAAYETGRVVTWQEIMSKREKFEFNTKGLKA